MGKATDCRHLLLIKRKITVITALYDRGSNYGGYMNRKFNKLTLLLPIAVSSALVGCSQSTSTTVTLSQTSLDAFYLQCQSIQQPNKTDAAVTGISLVGRDADAPFDTSAAEIVSYDSCTGQALCG